MYSTGDHVVIEHPHAPRTVSGKVFTVTKVLPVNIDLAPVSEGMQCRVPQSWVRPATAKEAAAARAAATTTPPLEYGSVVTVHGRTGYFVVIALPNRSRAGYKLVALGGAAEGRYLLVTRPALTLIERDRIDIAPGALAA